MFDGSELKSSCENGLIRSHPINVMRVQTQVTRTSFLILIVGVVLQTLTAQVVDIPDPGLQKAIRVALGKPAGDRKGRGGTRPYPTFPSRPSALARDPILARAIEMARWDAAQITPTKRPTIKDDWTWLWLGVAEYRGCNLAASLEALAKARNAFNLAVAGTAYAFSALASQANRQSTEAAGFLQEGESHLQELMAGNADRLSQYWHEVAMLELALREARAAIGDDRRK